MREDVHYEVDERKRTVGVTEDGVEFVEDQLGIDNLYEAANTPLVGYLNNALKAKELFNRDKDYIVRNGEVLIVDEFTGRVLVGPPLQRGHAPGHRGQGEGRDQGGEPDAGHDHPAELLPPLRQALRHDRHRPDRGRRAAPDLQARRGADPDQQADGPRRPDRPDLQDRGGQVRRGRRRHRRAAREGPAGAGRHHQRRAVGVPVQAADQARHPARGAQRQAPRAGGARSSPRPAARARSRWPPTWPAAAPTSCSAATRTSSPTSALREPGPRPGRDAGGVRGRLGRRRSTRSRPRSTPRPRRSRGRRPVRARHRAARVAPHRQPAARPLRPPGRPGRVAVLPVAG